MAITTTNARYEGFIFDGENSRDYGVYVTDVEVFGAPVRNVEMISIPGRNGSFVLDKGSYENIQVTYKCAMGCGSQADFNAGISAFRNMLASRTGYKRLEDEINTSEYRMACFRGGISVPTLNKETAKFDVVFDCKPQRYLKSGETAVSISSGGTISNPTLYDARPLISCIVSDDGYINIGNQPITFNPAPLGTLTLVESATWSDFNYPEWAEDIRLKSQPYNSGDTITMVAPYELTMEVSFPRYLSYTESHTSGGIDLYSSAQSREGKFVGYYKNPTPITFVAGTASTKTMTISIDLRHQDSPGGSTITTRVSYTITLAYNGARTITHTVTKTSTHQQHTHLHGRYGSATVDSSTSSFSGTVYVDLDLGEAYTIDGSTIASVNNFVSMGSEPPVLQPGDTQITFGGVSNVIVTPRWWQL